MTSKKANGLAVLVLLCTLILSFLLPGYPVILSGLLVVIFLSFFARKKNATIVGGAGSLAIVMIHMAYQFSISFNWERFSAYVFLLVLIIVASFIVLYIKNLVFRMELDKSHITSLFENATEGFVVTDSHGSIVLVNPSACRMFSYEQDELIGQPIEILIPRQYKSSHVKMRDGFYANPQNRVMGHGRDLHGEKKGGTTFPVEVSLSTYMQNSARFVIAFIVDITRRKEIEKNMISQQQQLEQVTNEMRQLNAELEAKVEERTVILKEALQRLEQSQDELSEALDKERQLNEIKSRFVSMASHEFRTPLSTVLSSASLLSKYTTTEDQEKRNRHITKIKGSVKHLNDLLEDFLSLGKLDEGKVGAVFNEFHLPELFNDIIDEMKGLVKHGQHILYSHEGEQVIDSDKKLFRNIMINLISNAIKFSDEEKDIQVTSKIDHDLATFTVSDHGIGISKEDQDHLFSSFFRGKNAINIQGTGLGLHIVKRYLDLLGGSIFLDSELGKGTTITFTIPVKHN